jgi:hypothetical protein
VTSFSRTTACSSGTPNATRVTTTFSQNTPGSQNAMRRYSSRARCLVMPARSRWTAWPAATAAETSTLGRSSRWPGRTLRVRWRLRSQGDVPHVLTVRTHATPRQLRFMGQQGVRPMALRAYDVNRRMGVTNRHSMQSSESM